MKLIPFVEENKDKLDWDRFSFSPNAIELLEENIDKFDEKTFIKTCCF
jgi:hypothetical protein